MKRKIIVIDDDKDFVLSLRMILEPAGYEVFEAGSAEEGVMKMETVRPDLIILDVMMESDTAGFHLAYKLKSSPDRGLQYLRKVPILMLSSIVAVKKIRFNRETDGDFLPVEEFMEKPVSPERLLKTVRRLIFENP